MRQTASTGSCGCTTPSTRDRSSSRNSANSHLENGEFYLRLVLLVSCASIYWCSAVFQQKRDNCVLVRSLLRQSHQWGCLSGFEPSYYTAAAATAWLIRPFVSHAEGLVFEWQFHWQTLGSRCEFLGLSEITLQTDGPFHRACGTFKNPHCSMAISLILQPFPCNSEWKIFERIEKKKIFKNQICKLYLNIR